MRTWVSRHAGVLAVVLALTAATLMCMTALQETDIFWSIREGNRLMATGNFMPVETWNFQAAGKLWLPNSWLWNVILAGFWNVGQIYGLVILNAATFALSLFLIWRVGKNLAVPRRRTYAFLLLGACLLYPFFSDRAITADIVLLLAYAWVATRLLATKRLLLPLGLLTLVFACVGMNLHLTAPIYGLLFPAIALSILLPRVPTYGARIRLLLVAGVATAIGILLTPYGFEGIYKALIVADTSRTLIIEWNPPVFTTYVGLSTWFTIAVGAALALYLLYRRRLYSVLPLLVFIIASSQATRFSLYLAVLIILLGLQHLHLGRHLTLKTRTNLPGLALFGAGIVLLLALVPTLTTLTDPGRIIQTGPDEFTHIPAHARVLSGPPAGSAIIMFRPDATVAVDGRNDLLGRHDYIDALNHYYHMPIPELRTWLDQKHIDAIYVSKVNELTIKPRIEALHWQRYESRWGYTYVRPGAADRS
jgi:hypothetical protein